MSRCVWDVPTAATTTALPEGQERERDRDEVEETPGAEAVGGIREPFQCRGPHIGHVAGIPVQEDVQEVRPGAGRDQPHDSCPARDEPAQDEPAQILNDPSQISRRATRTRGDQPDRDGRENHVRLDPKCGAPHDAFEYGIEPGEITSPEFSTRAKRMRMAKSAGRSNQGSRWTWLNSEVNG